MFGYIRVKKSELLVREYEAYKSVYCGLCRALGREYSVLSRFILSYDCAFYAMFLMSLRSSCEGFERKACRFNPLKKCSYCKCSDSAVNEAAALSVILAYYKLEDDIDDSGFFKRITLRPVKPFFSRWRKKAAARYPELDKIAAEMMEGQKKAENSPDCTLDMAAHPSADMLSKLIAREASSETEGRIYSRFGYGIGRFIYLIDAADDYEKDIKNDSFNPFKPYADSFEETVGANLSQALAMAYEAYNLIELVDFKGIIDNIILMGLPTVQKDVLDRQGKVKK